MISCHPYLRPDRPVGPPEEEPTRRKPEGVREAGPGVPVPAPLVRRDPGHEEEDDRGEDEGQEDGQPQGRRERREEGDSRKGRGQGRLLKKTGYNVC